MSAVDDLPAWVRKALLEHRNPCLSIEPGGLPYEIAVAILEALPKAVIATAIRETASAVFKMRNIRDDAGDLARELGNNATQSVLLLLTIGEENEDLAGVANEPVTLPASER